MSDTRSTGPADTTEPFVHPWCIPGLPRTRYAHYLSTQQARDAFVLLAFVLVLLGHGWALAALGFACGCDVAATRLHRRAWTGLNVPHGAVPTPPAVARVRGLSTLVLTLPAAAAVAGQGELGAFAAVFLGTVSIATALLSAVHDARAASMAPATASTLHTVTAVGCFAIAATAGHLSAAAFTTHLITAAGLTGLGLLIRWAARACTTLRR